MTLVGADTEQLRSLADDFSRRSGELSGDVVSTISGRLAANPWDGPDRQQFDHLWNQQLVHQIRKVATELDQAAKTLRKNADDQDKISRDDGSFTSGAHPTSSRHAGGGGGGGGGGGWGTSATDNESASVGFTPRKGPRDVADHMKELAEMEPGSDGIRVQKILCEDGTVRYCVYVGGSGSTKDGAWGGRLGWEDNAPGVASIDNKTLDSIRAQINKEIDDPNAEIALFGFSQGGMVVQRLADESNGNVKMVMTYGSPATQEYRNYGGADVLRINHRSDPVPMVSVFSRNLATRGAAAALGIWDLANGGGVPPAPGQQATFNHGRWGVDSSVHGADHSEYLSAAHAFSGSKKPAHVQLQASLSRFEGTIISDTD